MRFQGSREEFENTLGGGSSLVEGFQKFIPKGGRHFGMKPAFIRSERERRAAGRGRAALRFGALRDSSAASGRAGVRTRPEKAAESEGRGDSVPGYNGAEERLR